ARSRNGTAVAEAFEVPGPTGMDGKEILLVIRTENIRTGDGPLRGRVLVVEPLGSHALLTVMVGNESIKVVAPADTTLRADEDLEQLFSAQWRDGRVPHIVVDPTAGDYRPGPDLWASAAVNKVAPRTVATSGIIQPPVHAIAVWRLLEVASNEAIRAR